MPENREISSCTWSINYIKTYKRSNVRDVGSWDSDFKKITSEIREKLVNILMQTSNINKIKNSDPYISIMQVNFFCRGNVRYFCTKNK